MRERDGGQVGAKVRPGAELSCPAMESLTSATGQKEVNINDERICIFNIFLNKPQSGYPKSLALLVFSKQLYFQVPF